MHFFVVFTSKGSASRVKKMFHQCCYVYDVIRGAIEGSILPIGGAIQGTYSPQRFLDFWRTKNSNDNTTQRPIINYLNSSETYSDKDSSTIGLFKLFRVTSFMIYFSVEALFLILSFIVQKIDREQTCLLRLQ